MNAASTRRTQASSAAQPDTVTPSALSAQELAIEHGGMALLGNTSERLLRIFDAIRGYGGPRVTLDRAVYFTEPFKATEGQPLVPTAEVATIQAELARYRARERATVPLSPLQGQPRLERVRAEPSP